MEEIVKYLSTKLYYAPTTCFFANPEEFDEY